VAQVNEAALIALALVLFFWGILTERLAIHDLTGPLVFLVSGFLLGNSRWGIVSVELESSTVHHLAEVTLALLLFADASTVRLAAARKDLHLTARLLGIGLPFSIVAGAALAAVLFPSLPVALAAFVGASLAPTDAALSASVIGDERLPMRVRRVLNVESGMNDGIATPVVTFCIAATAASLGLVSHSYDDGFGALVELALGVAVGVGVAVVGGRLVRLAHHRGWTQEDSRRYATLALALLAFLVATEAGGNPFVAAFIGGLVFGAAAPADAGPSTELTEMFGSLLSLALWFVFGAGFALPALERLDARIVAYAVLSLTLVRMVPVAISLARSGEGRATVAFVGWFGPRGLASVVFALLAVEELAHDPRITTALDIVTVTILLSVIAHGITARPLTGRYVDAVRKARSGPAEPSVARPGSEEQHGAPPA
jgi:NhaP-type Na+/H+ or K+/H+ antiporter